jgi:hypothetical protein
MRATIALLERVVSVESLTILFVWTTRRFPRGLHCPDPCLTFLSPFFLQMTMAMYRRSHAAGERT